MAIFGKWGYKRLGGKKGLTLIELLIVLVILAILAGVIVLAVGGIFGRTGEQAYNLVRDELQLAVISYMTNTSAGLPLIANSSTDIDVCLLLGSAGQLLREVPDGMRDANNGGTCNGTSDDNHYVWILDDGGNVASTCTPVGDGDCSAAGDGFRDVWP